MNADDRATILQKLQAIQAEQVQCHKRDTSLTAERWWELECWQQALQWVFNTLTFDPVADLHHKRATVLAIQGTGPVVTIIDQQGHTDHALWFASDRNAGMQGWATWCSGAWVFAGDCRAMGEQTQAQVK